MLQIRQTIDWKAVAIRVREEEAKLFSRMRSEEREQKRVGPLAGRDTYIPRRLFDRSTYGSVFQ